MVDNGNNYCQHLIDKEHRGSHDEEKTFNIHHLFYGPAACHAATLSTFETLFCVTRGRVVGVSGRSFRTKWFDGLSGGRFFDGFGLFGLPRRVTQK